MLELSLKEYDGSLLKSSQKEVLSEYMDMTQVRHKQVSKWLFFKGGNYASVNHARFLRRPRSIAAADYATNEPPARLLNASTVQQEIICANYERCKTKTKYMLRKSLLFTEHFLSFVL